MKTSTAAREIKEFISELGEDGFVGIDYDPYANNDDSKNGNWSAFPCNLDGLRLFACEGTGTTPQAAIKNLHGELKEKFVTARQKLTDG